LGTDFYQHLLNLAFNEQEYDSRLEGDINMRTPAGFECPFFYGNYFRGRSHEECRLIGDAAPPRNWTPKLCNSCPIPGIIRANSCPNIVFEADVQQMLFGLKKQVKIKAFCRVSQKYVDEPEIGCGQCHPIPPVFMEKSE
jgi:hypothetical protein